MGAGFSNSITGINAGCVLYAVYVCMLDMMYRKCSVKRPLTNIRLTLINATLKPKKINIRHTYSL